MIFRQTRQMPVEAPETCQSVALVLDLDGTLLRTDLLLETLWAALGRDLLATLLVLIRYWTSPACLKKRLRQIAQPDMALLPVRKPVLDIARRAIAEGRDVHLVSAADQMLVDAVARRLDLPGPHFGSQAPVNLKGETKARLLSDLFGARGYDYAGDSAADLACWAKARRVIVVNPGPRLAARIAALGRPVQTLRDGRRVRALLREIRSHQWVKNLLLLLPVLAAHDFSAATVLPVLIALAGFCLGASAIYMVNDMLDLDADRAHAEKRRRPIASGALPLRCAMLASPLLGLAAIALGLAVSSGVAAMIVTYMSGSLIYSLWLKKRRWVDVASLAMLFVLRLLSGALAAGIVLSIWLPAFVFTVFLSLACVKRLTELARASRRGRLPGRGYGQRHFKALSATGYGAVAVAALLFVGYAFNFPTPGLYSSPFLLALAALPGAIWLTRLVRLGAQGREDYDPVIFISHDRLGMLIASAGLALAVAAI